MTAGLFALACVIVAGCERSSSAVDGAVPTWTLVEDQRIGSVDDETRGFIDIRFVLVGRDRTLYAVQPLDIRLIDSSGRFVARAGRAGQGPGEFRRIDRAGFLGDTLWVADEQSDRLTRFDRSGAFISASSQAYKPRFPGALLANGTSLRTTTVRGTSGDSIQVLVRVPGHPGRQAGSEARPSPEVFGRSIESPADTSPRPAEDTIAVLSRRNWSARVPIQFPYNKGPVQIIFFQPLSDSPLWRASADGRYLVFIERPAATTAETADYVVTQLTASLDTVFRSRLAYEPVPVSAALIDSILTNSEEGKLGMKREAVFAPAFRPPVTEVLIGNNGGVWLKREFRYGADAPWLILDRDGRPVAQVSIPQRHSVRAADDQYLWTTMTDENDVPFIVRYRIVKPGRS